MASAVFAVPFTTHIGPDLSALGEDWLYYTDGNGERAGGFACIGHVPYPLPPATCLVRVWSSLERIAQMAVMDDYLFIEDVDEQIVEVDPMADLDAATAERMEADPKFRTAVQAARALVDETLRPAAEAEGLQLESNAEVDARLAKAKQRGRKVQVPPVTPPSKPPQPERPTKAKAKTWLKGKGYKAKDVNDVIDRAVDVVAGLRALHGVSAEQYRSALSG